MDDDPGLELVVEGVVRNGRVVTDTPLNVADGTRVTIRSAEHAVATDGEEPARLTEEQIRWFQEHAERLRTRPKIGRDDSRAA